MSRRANADLDELWATLEPHIDWPEGLTLILLFASNAAVVDELRQRAHAVCSRSGRTLRVFAPASREAVEALPGELLEAPAPEVGALWVELWDGHGWDTAITGVLARLNQFRTVLEREVGRPTVLILPASFRLRVYMVAPDLWTIRSFSTELPSRGYVARGGPMAVSDGVAAPGSAAFAIAPPSRAEREWARLVGTAKRAGHVRVDPVDGVRAFNAALRRGSLAGARRIAVQFVELADLLDDVELRREHLAHARSLLDAAATAAGLDPVLADSVAEIFDAAGAGLEPR
ncbi:hypothetical protein DB30_05426 [Enhygromyxa salina]|uniref:DUF4123 domain-containing protein n=1 Tax=Enhygromyxa salina TaxID=215803 RepID=A0A0C1ZX83_9BACT|nr:hypothetical protein [Enhygromyxa salina]KIG15678.1 hypothetical protein DB30_05426 [Enhygromyxa salina]